MNRLIKIHSRKSSFSITRQKIKLFCLISYFFLSALLAFRHCGSVSVYPADHRGARLTYTVPSGAAAAGPGAGSAPPSAL